VRLGAVARAPVHPERRTKGRFVDRADGRHRTTELARTGDGRPDELWTRLNRGNGEVDDDTAAWLDRSLDDGRADAGKVRVTPTWIWFELAER